MTGALVLLLVGIVMVFGGFVGTLPESLDRNWRRPEGFDRGEEMGNYVVMAIGGVVAAAGFAVFLAEFLGNSDSQLGPALAFAGATLTWMWIYDILYRRLRRPEPDSRWARLVGAVGNLGKRAGPIVLLIGLVTTVAL